MVLEGLKLEVKDEQLQPVPLSWWELKQGLSAASTGWDPSWWQTALAVAEPADLGKDVGSLP